MRFNWMASAALALGLSAAVPAVTRAGDVDRGAGDPVGHRHDHDRDYDRSRDRDYGRDRDGRYDRDRHDHDHDHDRGYGKGNTDVLVDVRRVPRAVLSTARREGDGRHVEFVRYVRRNNREFYVLRMSDHDRVALNVHVHPGGQLIGVDRQ